MRALGDEQHTRVRLLNYDKAGEPFFNTVECFPLHTVNDVKRQLTSSRRICTHSS